MFFKILYMKYLIKLEDRESNREVMIECPARMILEELNIKIKSELHLPCTDEDGHCFQINGKVYVPRDYVVTELWDYYDDMSLPIDVDIQHRINYPRKKDIRSSWRFRLNQVFTVKGSVIAFVQSSQGHWFDIKCTLIDRID